MLGPDVPSQCKVHPRTAELIYPLGFTKRGTPIWPVMGAEDAPPPDAPPRPADEPAYPKNTPVEQMTAEQQVAYWQTQSRKHEQRVKGMADYSELKTKAAKADQLEAANATEQEKAAKAAREEGKAEALQEAAPRLVAAEFRAAAKGVLTDGQRDALLEDLDLTKYLTAKGEVDVDKVTKKVTAFAPQQQQGSGRGPDMGQGNRGGTSKVSAAEAGKAEAERRFGKKTTTSA